MALQARIKDRLSLFDATELATELMGDSIFSNMMVFGAAWLQSLVPVSHAAIFAAIELNGAAVDKNKRAFELGRWAVLYPEKVLAMTIPIVVDLPKSLETGINFELKKCQH